MVWGMNFPSSFGDFWPEGQFEVDESGQDGWSERLKSHYMEQSPEKRKGLFTYVDESPAKTAHFYSGYVARKFINEIGSQPDHTRPPPTSIKDHEPPQSFYTEKTYKNLGSMIALNYGLLAVDEELKAIIERVEPNKHQFFPIAIIMPKGVVYPKKYYILVIGQYCSSFSPEKSKSGSFRAIPNSDRFSHTETKAGITGLALAKDVYGKAHLWRERRLSDLSIFFSDELQAEIEKAGLRIPKHYKMMEA